MGGFSREFATAAIGLGWKRDEITAAHHLCRDLRVTEVTSFAAFAERRWLVYRGLAASPDLELAMSTRLPIEAKLGLTVAYADGSGTTSEKRCGAGVAIYEPGRPPRYVAEHEGLGTNNVAELLAIWRALKAVPDVTRRLLIRSDSEYAINSVRDRRFNPVKNKGLVEAVREDVAFRRSAGQSIEFQHVYGHEGEEGNEAANLLANLARTVATAAEARFAITAGGG
jgi:ribonuclease HI